MPELDFTHASDLCVSCGLCCEGAVYERVPIEPEEFGSAVSLGLPITMDLHGVCFSLPCPRLEDKCCTVYESRPARCRDFYCKTAKELICGEISRELAFARVGEANARAQRLLGALAGESIPEYRKRREDAFERGEALERTAARDCLVALDEILDRDFRKPEQNRTKRYDTIEGRGD